MFAWFARLPAYRADFEVARRLDPDVLDLPCWPAQPPDDLVSGHS